MDLANAKPFETAVDAIGSGVVLSRAMWARRSQTSGRPDGVTGHHYGRGQAMRNHELKQSNGPVNRSIE